MPHVYESTFRIRHYECDATGRVNQANYLRVMQEIAYAASAEVGYDMVGYRSLGRLWYIRETEVTFGRSLKYGDQIYARTWVKDFHRVRSIRAYELRKVDTEECIANAWSDWVFLDTETGLPSSIPDMMIKAFIPDPQERISQPRRRFPSATQPDHGTFICQRRVDWRDLDPIQHVNNAVYFSYFEECGLMAYQAVGWSRERMAQNGFDLKNQKLQIEYRQPAFYGEQLDIATWITNLDSESITRHFTAKRSSDGELLCQARLHSVWDAPISGGPVAVPDVWLGDLAAMKAEV